MIHKREPDLIIGTFGRVAWVLDDIEPLRQIAKNPKLINKPSCLTLLRPIMLLTNNLQELVLEAMQYIMVKIAQKRDVLLSISADSNRDKKLKLEMQLFRNEELIKTLTREQPKEKGIYRWIWDLSEEAVDRPQREEVDSDDDDDDEEEERSGKPVLPGTYSVVLTNGTIRSKAKIDVALDLDWMIRSGL